MMTTPENALKYKIPIRLFDAPKRGVQRGDKILLLKLGERIGDFVTAIDAFSLIRNTFPQAEITLVAMPFIVDFAVNSGLFDHVVPYAHVSDVMNEGKVKKADQEIQLAAFKEILDGHYLLAADFRQDGSTRPWLDYVDATYRAGFSATIRSGLDIVIPEMEWDVPVTKFANKKLSPHAETRGILLAQAIIDALGDKHKNATIFPFPEHLLHDPVYLKLRDDKRLKIGLSLGAGSELRQWSDEYWITLLRHLSLNDDPVFVFFGGEAEKLKTKALISNLDPLRCINLIDGPSLAHIPNFVRLLDVYIGCDTGMTHLAGKLEIPTINIFAGIGNISTWCARGPKVKTIYAEVICAPCHLRFKDECPNNNVCMKAIIPEIVYACFEQVIANNNK